MKKLSLCICILLIATVVVPGCIWDDQTEKRVITVADKHPDNYLILGIDGNQYRIADFYDTVANPSNDLNVAQGRTPLVSYFWWNKAIKINDTLSCDFRVAASGEYILTNCSKIWEDTIGGEYIRLTA